MFGKLSKATESSDCFPCPANTFSEIVGSIACRPCGSSALASGGAAKCDCLGKNRMFQVSDGSCVCKSGFIFYDDVDVQKDEGNSAKDCQEIVSISLSIYLYVLCWVVVCRFSSVLFYPTLKCFQFLCLYHGFHECLLNFKRSSYAYSVMFSDPINFGSNAVCLPSTVLRILALSFE